MVELETRIIRKVSLRLIPFLMVCYFIAYIDRVNVGFAAVTMNPDLGLSAAAYGFGAGIFFLAYFFFEVPSNLFLERFGARRWIARIMLTWGIIAGIMAFIRPIGRFTGLGNENTFYLLRFLLGVAEAGFFPGMIFYFTLWFPSAYRARVTGYFMAAIPLSTAIGAPISGLLLNLDGMGGLAGWQWMYIIEAAPAVILAVVTYFYLTDRPAEARWLTVEEREWLVARLNAEHREKRHVGHFKLLQTLLNPRVLALAVVYFGVVVAGYGVSFWLPQIVKAFGLSHTMTGLVTAVPSIVAVIGMIFICRHSDRTQERRIHTSVALFLAGAGVLASAVLTDPWLKMLALSLSVLGASSAKPLVWTFPATFLSGGAAAAGIAAINSIGNLGGFVGPYAVGWAKDAFGSYLAGFLLIGACPMIAAAIILVLGRDRRAPAAAAAPSAASV
jgi:ACS family tartrate transporter-like MFS transporter